MSFLFSWTFSYNVVKQHKYGSVIANQNKMSDVVLDNIESFVEDDAFTIVLLSVTAFIHLNLNYLSFVGQST